MIVGKIEHHFPSYQRDASGKWRESGYEVLVQPTYTLEPHEIEEERRSAAREEFRATLLLFCLIVAQHISLWIAVFLAAYTIVILVK
jgi:hypothetical protein